MLGLKLNHVSKRGHRGIQTIRETKNCISKDYRHQAIAIREIHYITKCVIVCIHSIHRVLCALIIIVCIIDFTPLIGCTGYFAMVISLTMRQINNCSRAIEDTLKGFNMEKVVQYSNDLLNINHIPNLNHSIIYIYIIISYLSFTTWKDSRGCFRFHISRKSDIAVISHTQLHR